MNCEKHRWYKKTHRPPTTLCVDCWRMYIQHDELCEIEMWNARADMIDGLLKTGLFSKEWLLKRFNL